MGCRDRAGLAGRRRWKKGYDSVHAAAGGKGLELVHKPVRVRPLAAGFGRLGRNCIVRARWAAAY